VTTLNTEVGEVGETDAAAKRDVQMQRIYAAVGRFVVEYENAVYMLRVLAWFTLDLINKPLGQRLAQVVTAELSNRALREVTLAAILERYAPNDDDAKLIKKVFQKMDCLEQDQRNPIVHSTWFIGYGNEATTDWDEAVPLRMRVRNGKLRIGGDSRTAEDFEAVTNEALEIGAMLQYVHDCLLIGVPVTARLRLDPQGQVCRV